MTRTAQYNPTVKEIRWKPSHRNSSSMVHGARQRKERREITIKYYSHHTTTRCVGYAVTLEVIYDLDPRGKLRAYVNAGQLRSLPPFIRERLSSKGIDTSLKRPRFSFYRVSCALWGCQLDKNTDCHHINGDCLDDRSSNLQLLDKDEHALHHMNEDADIEAFAEDGVGFFDYRSIPTMQLERSKQYAEENCRRKALGLEPIGRTNGTCDNDKLFALFMHRQLRNKLLEL